MSTRENHLEMEIDGEKFGQTRRRGDRPVAFRVELEFGEKRVEKANSVGLAKGNYVISTALVTIRPRRRRNRRHQELAERARHILLSLKAYLMAKEVNAEGEEVDAAAGASRDRPGWKR